jgi:hypothetical protein
MQSQSRKGWAFDISGSIRCVSFKMISATGNWNLIEWPTSMPMLINIAATSSRNSTEGCFSSRWAQEVVGEAHSSSVKAIKIEGTHGGLTFEVCVRFDKQEADHEFLESDYVTLMHHRSPLLTRGWVFQELYLAPRTIHFHCSELILECKDSIRCECSQPQNVPFYRALSRHRMKDKSTVGNSNEKLFSWLAIVGEFCKLNLTHESDRLPALAGLASRFYDSTIGNYVGGLWQNDLVRMLLWSLRNSGATSWRSEASDAPSSWSWASIMEYEDPHTRGENSSNYILVSYNSNSFRQDLNVEIIKAECTLQGFNPYRQVTAGTIIIRGMVLQSKLVRRCLEIKEGYNELYYSLWINWSRNLEFAHMERVYSAHDIVGTPERCVGADLIFDQEEDGLLIVTSYIFTPDINLGKTMVVPDGDGVFCLFLGTALIPSRLDIERKALCLVLKDSSKRDGAFERIGVMMCDSDDRIFLSAEERIIELV